MSSVSNPDRHTSEFTPHVDAPSSVSAAVAAGEASIPTVVSAAWELELVIAGGITFALFQLPSSIDALRAWLDPRISGSATFAMLFVYIYVKLTVYVLLGAFLLNLTARAYWVGLVGLHSVFPRGVAWERMRLGPAAIETYRTRLVSLPASIARVDNFASIIFSFAFLIVVFCLFSLVGAAIASGLGWGINTLLLGGRHGLAASEIVLVVLTGPLAAIGLIDKKLGARWAPDSAAGRRLRRAMRIVARLNGTALFGPIFFTLLTNLRRGVMLTLFYVVFLGGMLVAMAELFVRLGLLSSGNLRYLPEDEAVRGMRPDFYESMRAADASTIVPTIQSDVIDGPYVRLFIPYLPDQHDPALASCPGAAPQRPAHVHLSVRSDDRAASERAADAALGCLARIHAIALDGTPRPDVPLRFTTHPSSGRVGMIAYIATSGLAAGPHELRVMPAPRRPDSSNTRPRPPYDITFYK